MPENTGAGPISQTTGLVWNSRFQDHTLGPGHPESPRRLKAVEDRLQAAGLLDSMPRLNPLPDPLPYLRLIHSEEHIGSVARIPVTGEIATLAAAGALGAVQAVHSGKVRNAFCALRPPGHHAHDTGEEEGFCFFNNVAVAARYAQQELGLRKILIADWDYHHGNATQDVFYEDPDVLFFSTHRWDAYPGTGDPALQGNGDGTGFNINVPLPSGATDADILRAFESSLLPMAMDFQPDLVLISAGFDSRQGDFLGDFRITDETYKTLTRMLMAVAHQSGHDRVVSLLEGGYNPEGLACAVEAHVEALQGG
jgi:acetoin utilization deacetylase AcuC-like enzyme